MRMPWHRKPAQPVSFEEAVLAALGVTLIIPPDGSGMWVYGLRNAAGETFYVGQSAQILTRLGAHRKVYRATLTSVWLVPCEDAWDMTVTEDFLIKRLKPVMNVHGMSDETEKIKERIARKASRQKAVNAGLREVGLQAGWDHAREARR